MKGVPKEEEIFKSFKSFFNVAFEFLARSEDDFESSKIALVNLQIALEILLKYYLIKTYGDKSILTPKGDYKTFEESYNFYFSENRERQFLSKSKFKKITEIRNNLVHCGSFESWNHEIFLSLMQSILFMQRLLWETDGIRLFKPESAFGIDFHLLTGNSHWNRVVAETTIQLQDINPEICPLFCPFCKHRSSVILAHAMYNIEDFEYDAYWSPELLCLNCFWVYDTISFKLDKCWNCEELSYYIDLLNVQRNQLFIGNCLNSECRVKQHLRKCSSCGDFYHPNDPYKTEKEIKYKNKYYCSKECSEFEID
ncbi:HEPN domain-containing protein [Paenibacillus polysaccharolyticus]|uniref:HEPN domain-containing protein n=1 Tax=Paenibacillus polysaccharolyticus TaxID=582692 RepID=UPI00209FBA34|nr:HEPN domain-containing protein [Paenibacillus polysaccharolyticus]MCP1132911.1 HEPN domain-containing protein [Paenibacillus polysaccharolyticus]